MGLKLGFHYHIPALFKEGQIYTPGYQAVFIDSLAPYCEKITCFLHSPREDEVKYCNSSIKASNVDLVDIGIHASVPMRMLCSRKYTSPLRKRRGDLDLLLLRGASPLLPAMALCVPEIPKALLIVSSYLEGIDTLPQPWWRKELIRLWANRNTREQLKIAKKSITFVNSARLYADFQAVVPDLNQIRTTTISNNDIHFRVDTPSDSPKHILFSGRITAEKGIFDIVDALSQINRGKIDFILDIVGMPENEAVMQEFWKYSEQKDIKGKIHYYGFKEVGDELLSFYRRASVLLNASKSNFEGFPRTIWEAFSQGTPVIATSVGSIPFFLRNEQDALITTPNCPSELANAITRIFSDEELRRRLIANGYKLARETTVELQAQKMISIIRERLYG